ncbi:hypothetical protein ACFXMT_18640 [Streptomyces mirabilis]
MTASMKISVSLGALRAAARSAVVLTTNDRAVVSGRSTLGRSA